MKEIKLTQGFVTQVDDEDYEYLNQWKWCTQKDRNNYYAVRSIKKKLKKMSRIIINAPDGMQVDHIDHNGLNNQKYNLRICTNSQNCMNRRPYGKSKYLGVVIDKGKYIRARIKVNGKLINLGTFETEENAAKIRDEASIKYFGEFANLNLKIK